MLVLADFTGRSGSTPGNLIDFSEENPSQRTRDDLAEILDKFCSQPPQPVAVAQVSRNIVYPRAFERVATRLANENPGFCGLGPLRLAMIGQSRPFLGNGVTRSHSSYPDISRAFPASGAHSRSSAGDILAVIEKETRDRLQQSGNLIDLGTKIKDGGLFQPTRPFSQSSESSGGSPFINGGDFHTWETFDEVRGTTQLPRAVSQDVSDLAFLAEPDIFPGHRLSPKLPFDVQNDRLTLLKVKSENENLRSFFRMVYRLQRDFQYDDELTNIGFIRAPMVEEFQRNLTGTIRLSVEHKPSEATVTFECDVQVRRPFLLSTLKPQHWNGHNSSRLPDDDPLSSRLQNSKFTKKSPLQLK
jgi:hypothetical protein